ncbi:MAG: hypothetical protein AAF389_09240 [Gemmatimonadota bacterium]
MDPSPIIPDEVLEAAIGGYPLYPYGTHGLGHWARVLENGMRLAPLTGADPVVVALFAVLHDCRRHNEGTDPGHGRRGAEVVDQLEGRIAALSPQGSALLRFACAHHTDGTVHDDPTLGTCWDADRLDLGRVGIRPRPGLLCTAAARDEEVIRWATERARHAAEPAFVEEYWSGFVAADRAGGPESR